jgi:hypothetical protein
VTRTAVGGARATIAAHGLRVTLPERWEGRLYLRDRVADTETGESINPVLHLANFALPPARGDFGSGAVEVMSAAHVFVALLEYDPADADGPLFAANGLPRPSMRDFASNALQRTLPGQLGCQKFFTEHGRAFCLYVVLGSRQHAARLLDEVHSVLDSVLVGQR